MAKSSHILIDGQQHETEVGPRKPSSLLQLAGKSAEDTSLVLEDGQVCANPDDPINVVSGQKFTTREQDPSDTPDDKPICYFVNGESNSTIENPLTVQSILQNAGAGAAIDTLELESYYLENTSDGRRYENLDDMVTITDGDNFLAIHVGSTPVANLNCGDIIMEELEKLALGPRTVRVPDSKYAVTFDMAVKHGVYKGETLQITLSFQEDGYPEYPPHFVHFKSNIKPAKIPVHSTYQFEGENWSVYSLPPSDFWDRLPSSEKNMKTYLNRHLLRVLADL